MFAAVAFMPPGYGPCGSCAVKSVFGPLLDTPACQPSSIWTKSKPNGLSRSGREGRQLGQVFFVAAPPCLSAYQVQYPAGCGGSLIAVDRGDRVGVGFQSQPCVVEPAQREGFALGVLAGLDAEPPVVDLRPHADLPLLDRRKHDAAAPIVGEPTADHARARARD